ncbi:MAG: GNAT family N-acetyltransferase [Bacteroidetes bacterium]|nr:GNAT family N-acetyltransferase [Bacteroidota bacterium]
MIAVKPYTNDLKEEWNTFVANADNSNFLFNRNFMEYHSDRFTDVSVLLYDEDALVGIFPANRKENTVFSHQGLTYGGLVLNERRNVKKLIEYYHSVFSYFSLLGVTEIVYKPVPSYLCKTVNDLEHFVLNILNAQVSKVDTAFVIDYKNEIKFQERRRRSVKKGEKVNTEIKSDNDFAAYWNHILVPNLRDKFGSAPVHSLEEITLLHARFPEQIKQVNAYINNEIVAGVTLFEFNGCVHCQYISSNDYGRDSGAIDLLFNNLIHLYQKDKLFFGLGTANNNGNDINIGLCEWKEGWGAKIHAQFHYRFKTENINALERFFKSHA